jgi:hypothetical protein
MLQLFPSHHGKLVWSTNNQNEFIKSEAEDEFLTCYQKLLVNRHTSLSDSTFCYIITELWSLFIVIISQIQL